MLKGMAQAVLPFVTITALLTSAPASAQEFKKTIMTGGPTGTYIQIGRDIDTVGKQCGMNLTVQESAGSLENIRALYSQPNTQFAIVQHDVLGWMKRFQSQDAEVSRIVSQTRLVFPLYNEEVHLVAKKDITSLTDLQGKRVSVGGEGSGTSLTASFIMDLANVAPSDLLNLGSQASLEQLLAGEIDAFFYVAGAPTKLLESPDLDGSAFHLVPIENEAVTDVYTSTSIPAGTYPWQTEEVPLVAAKAVLMTYNFDPDKNAYHAAACDAISDYANLIVTNKEFLEENGHPKWQTVDFQDIPPGWEFGQCVARGLSEDYVVEGCVADEPLESTINQQVLNFLNNR